MNNYYELLDLKPIHSEFQLFKAYLKATKIALKNKDIELFKKVRQGYEVCGYEKSLLAYHRIFKKTILKKNLNYPAKKEEELINTYQAKEIKAASYIDSFNKQLPSYSSHLMTIILKLLLRDITRIIPLGQSGILFITVGLYCIISFPNETNTIGGMLLILLGLFFARSNFKMYINQG